MENPHRKPAVEIFPKDIPNQSSTLFSPEVEANEWIAFHGTSAANAALIESDGFNYSEALLAREDLTKVLDIYNEMDWFGEDAGGRAVLESFSLNFDLRESTGSPIFFGESSRRSLLYASRDFAGGEKLRGIRRSIADLRKYLADPQIRETHQRLSARSVFEPVDLGWLESELNKLSDIEQLALEPYESYSGGVVLAVEFQPEDLEILSYSDSMGITADRHVPSARIVATMHVEDSDTVAAGQRMDKLAFHRKEHGLEAKIRARAGAH